eukprot:CAMPEP_0183433998 /NCGR_PEP_ID=MMETSP0370-20130417/61750_1 /TAXON_ID=268820 /ORGANISM="Peridinium aciculiferum, Strain PAER-2" /LENGTH=83 /DNA_ID=CAMNT_0025620475 /DNA_START=10 /DNA_END=261 /DNA_ORIENTATION=+
MKECGHAGPLSRRTAHIRTSFRTWITTPAMPDCVASTLGHAMSRWAPRHNVAYANPTKKRMGTDMSSSSGFQIALSSVLISAM